MSLSPLLLMNTNRVWGRCCVQLLTQVVALNLVTDKFCLLPVLFIVQTLKTLQFLYFPHTVVHLFMVQRYRLTETLLRFMAKLAAATPQDSHYGLRYRRSLHYIRVFQWREWKGELALNFDFVYTSLAMNSSCFAGFQNSNLICSCFFC